MLRQLSDPFLLVHFGFAVDACSITRHDKGVPFFRVTAARLVLTCLPGAKLNSRITIRSCHGHRVWKVSQDCIFD